jgi:membrane dipeptidase
VFSRRNFLPAAAGTLAAPFFSRRRFSLFAGSTLAYSTLTLDLVRDSLVVDMLGLLTLNYRKLIDWETNPKSFQAADLARLKSSGINVFHPSVGFIGGDIYKSSLRDITGWNAFLNSHPHDFLRVATPADLKRAKAENKIGIILGFQNSEHFREEEDVDSFYELGQRISQLTYARNRLGGGCSDPHDDGLTEFGGRIVQRMNRIGMAIDISHCADRTTLDVIEASQKPVLVTHSNCRMLVPFNGRCKTDDAIRRMAAKGGVMGVTMVRPFVRSAGPTNIENVLDHVDHIVRIAGVEHAALGSDTDLSGRDHAGPKHFDLDGLQYDRKIFDFTEGLIRRKYKPEDISLILGGNFQRAMLQICEHPETISKLPKPVAPSQ